MVDDLSITFAALADPTRRAILERLAQGEATVNELAAPFAMSLPSVSRHLKVLERAGLVSKGRAAQWRPCRLEADQLRKADEWMAPYRELFGRRFDRLEHTLRGMVEQGASEADGPRDVGSANDPARPSPEST
jgi:DNA-binding transcriptional ArsR family regulator